MSSLTVNAMQWNSLNHIADVKQIGDHNAECLEDIRVVLEKRNFFRDLE